MKSIFDEIVAERARQTARFGDPALPDGTGGFGTHTIMRLAKKRYEHADARGRLTFAHILDEEAAEVLAETDVAKLRVELVQLASVAIQWVQDIDRRGGGK